MRRLFLLAIFTFFLTSCASTGPRRDIPEHQLAFFDESPVGQSRAYREYKMLAPGERARISYLLWRMEYSPLKFWRNGSKYNGREGAGWLRWKLRKFYPHVNTAEGFINEVASRSENSQIPYKIYCLAYDCPHNLRDVLLAELRALEEFELKEAEVKAQQEALKASAAAGTALKRGASQESVKQISEETARDAAAEKSMSTITEPAAPRVAIQPAQAVDIKPGEISSAEQPERMEGNLSQPPAKPAAAPTEKSL